MKKYLLFLLLIVVASLSGCIHMLDTYEKQACLSATHFSTTSIPECTTQSKCLKEINKQNITISDSIPIELHNSIITYKNNIASSVYYFNKSKQTLKKINDACGGKKGIDIVDNINDLFFYLSNIFTYIDNSSEQSIIILKDYAIYLQSQDISNIPEEELYSDFVQINKNLNELKKSSNNESYILEVKKEAEKIHKVAKEFGFKKTYLSKTNYIDLTAYYYKLIDTPSNFVLVPKIAPGMNFVITKLANIEAYNKINLNLKKANSYNLFLVLNRNIGSKNSLFTKFIKMNNQINKDLKDITNKIKILEKYISENSNYLNEEDKVIFSNSKYDYKYNNLTFGKYLETLKELNINLKKNKLDEEVINIETNEKLKDCNITIDAAKKFNNVYFKFLIDKYNYEDNYINKLEICDNLKENINNKDCLSKLNIIYEKNEELVNEFDLFDMNSINQNQCINIINIVNYKLNKNENIILLNKINKQNLLIIRNVDYRLEESQFEIKKEILNYKEETTNISKLQNYEKIIDIDKKIERGNEIYEELIKITKKVLKDYLEDNYKIKIIDKDYFLVLENIFPFKLENVNLYLDLNYSKLKIDEIKLNKQNNNILIKEIFSGKNYYKIEYENEKVINENILLLSLNNSLLETTINNKILGIYDSLNLGQDIQLVNPNKYKIDKDNYVWYITEKENKILYYKKILDKEIKSIDIEEINEDKFTRKECFDIKNSYNGKVEGKIDLMDVSEDSIVLLKENESIIDIFRDENVLSFNISLLENEEKSYRLNILENKEQIYSEIEDIFVNIAKYKNSRFEDLRSEANNLFKNYKSYSVLDSFTINEIKEIYKYLPDIEVLKIKEESLINTEREYFILFDTLTNKKLTSEELIKIEENNNEKYKDIVYYLSELQKISREIEIKNKENINENNKKVIEYKEIIDEYNIKDEEVQDAFDNLNREDVKDFKEIDVKIKKYFMDKAKEIYKEISFAENELEIREIEEIIEKVYWLFEDYTLQDLYNVNYYPIITRADAERLEKKSKFLDTVMLSNEITEFEENYNSKEFRKAVDSISAESLKRLKDIFMEKELIENGVEELKKDAKKLLNEKIKEYPNSEKEKTNLEEAKDAYSLGKFINVIYLVKNITVEPKKNQKNKQVGIIGIIIICFALVYIYFEKNNKKKKISYNERKKRVLRHK